MRISCLWTDREGCWSIGISDKYFFSFFQVYDVGIRGCLLSLEISFTFKDRFLYVCNDGTRFSSFTQNPDEFRFPFVLRALIRKAPSVRQLWKFRLFHKEGTAGKTRILFPQLCNNMSWTD